MRSPRFILLAGVTCCALLACGLYLGGPDGPDASVPDATPVVPDQSAPDVMLPMPCMTLDASACLKDASLPDGWSLVALGASSASCPTHFTATPLVSDPTAVDGGCACGACQTSGSYACTGQATLRWGAVCINLNNAMVDAGECKQANDTTLSGTPPPLGGNVSCAAPNDAGTGAVVAAGLTACTPTKCEADFCGVGAGLERCIVTEGIAACPPGFTIERTVGTAAAYVRCECPCRVTDASCGGSIEAYTTDNCTGNPLHQHDIDNLCSGSFTAFESLKYFASPPPKPTCTTGRPVAEAGLVGVKTVCCL